MIWKDIQYNQETQDIKVPNSWLHVHYYEALNILFRFENSLRVFVYVILKDELKNNWDSTNIRGDDTIKKIASIRISQAKDYGYLCYDIKSPMLYLSSSDLIDIIMNDKNWKYFKKYFKAKKEIIKHKLLEIGAVRNSLAHFRPIQAEDLEVIKQNVKHTLSIVEECLNDITSIYTTVPTNNIQPWYLELKKLTNNYIKIDLFQDKKSDWIKISLIAKGITFKDGYIMEGYKSFYVSKLSTVNILNKYSEIKNNIIYAHEDFSTQIIDEKLIFSKYINLIISKQNLELSYMNIITDIADLINIISKEMKLLSQDNLAEGDLISSVLLSCRKEQNEKFWNIDREILRDNIYQYEGSEFWGESGTTISGEYITETYKYPWMPTNISKQDYYF